MSTKSKREAEFRAELRAQDLDAVRELVRATGFFTEAEVDVACELVSERLSKGASSGYEFLVAEHGGEILGYTCFGEIPCTVGSYDLYWIVVHPHAQGQGLGADLFRRTSAAIKLRGGRRVYAETSGRGQYQSTRDFYDRLGFSPEARLKDFYAPGDDKVVYSRAVV